MIKTFERYLKHEKRSSKYTVLSYITDLKQFADFFVVYTDLNVPESDEIPIQNAENHTIKAWIISLMDDEELHPRSVNRKIAALKAYYKFMESHGYIAVSPIKNLKRIKTDKPLPFFVKQQEMRKLFDEIPFAEDLEGQRDKLVFEMLYGTGIRISELLDLRKSNINFYEATVKVCGKGEKERIIPLNQVLLDFLRNYINLNPNEYLIITNKGESAYKMLVYRIVKKVLTQVTDIERKSPHVLRHTFATHLLEKGADLNAVKDLLGHATIVSTSVYMHNTTERLKAIFDKAHPKA
jgi:integrase/recombinase XerC